MPGKISTLSDKNATLTVLNSTETQRLSGLLSNTRETMQGVVPSTAYSQGVTLCKALKARKQQVKVLLLAELERLTRHVNATRTFQTQTDLQDAVDDICELFPSMKLEEVLLVFKHIRQGRYQLFGNFTTNVMLDCMRQYEMENTVTMREQEHQQRKNTIETASFDVKRLIDDLNRDGKLKNTRKLLDRKYIQYPNDKTDAKSTQQATQTTKEKDRTETNEARATS